LGESYYQPSVLYRNLGKGKFQDLTSEAGPAFQARRPARGLAVGDIDGDGQPAIVIVNMNSTPSLLYNEAPVAGHSINVSLIGTKSNRSAIGALVTVTVGAQKSMSTVQSGSSFYSQNSFVQHFGLGAATRVDRLEVRWPRGLVQSWTNVDAGKTVVAVEGRQQLDSIPFEVSRRK
jgi:hypothetical protein